MKHLAKHVWKELGPVWTVFFTTYYSVIAADALYIVLTRY